MVPALVAGRPRMDRHPVQSYMPNGVISSLLGTSTQSQMGGGSVLHGRVGAGQSTTLEAKISPGQAPSPMERGEHGSGTGVGSGAGDGRTSSPEQKLKWRHYETNDEVTWRFASDGDSVFPLGLSAPHDGYPVGNPRDGHHEGLTMTSNDDGIPMPMTMLFPGRTACDERFAHEQHANKPLHGRSHSLSGSMGDSPRGPAEYVAHGVPCVQQGIFQGHPAKSRG